MGNSANGKTIKERAARYLVTRQLNFFDQERIENLFLEAANEAYGFGDVADCQVIEYPKPNYPQIVSNDVQLTVDNVISESNWAVIKPLAHLFVELETAKLQEATKNHGLDPFGRSSAEIENDIMNYRNDLQKKMFACPILSIY